MTYLRQFQKKIKYVGLAENHRAGLPHREHNRGVVLDARGVRRLYLLLHHFPELIT